MSPDAVFRVRRSAPRSRSGCVTCKARHVRCDEQKPTCRTCERLGIPCQGYNTPRPWIFEPSTKLVAQTVAEADADDAGTVVQHSDVVHRIQSQQLPPKTRIFRPLQSTAGEPAVIAQAYMDLPPQVWDNIYNQPQDSAIVSKIDDALVPVLLTARNQQSRQLRYRTYLAVATSSLSSFQPEKYSMQLHFRYLNAAVAEIRKFISRNLSDSELEELLHGIARILLASVMYHDVDPARAHLAAAVTVVSQIGGIDAIDSQVAAILRYCDLHLATVTLRGFTFPVSDPFNDEDNPPTQALTADPLLAELAMRVRSDAKAAALPKIIQTALRGLLDTAMALDNSLSHGSVLADLTSVSTRMITTVKGILQHRPSVLSNRDPRPPAGASNPYHLSPMQRSGSGPEFDLEDWTIVLIMWCQLIWACINAPLSPVNIRSNILPLLVIPLLPHQQQRQQHQDAKSVWLASLSPPVRDGLLVWNQRAVDAQRATTETELAAVKDWESLVDLVADMEMGFPARMAPVVRRLIVMCYAQASTGAQRAD